MSAVIFLVAAASFPLFGHGTEYEIVSRGMIGVRTAFDTGEPMANAKVLVFAPGETKATTETTTDGNGIVCFVPDRAGTWVLQVRAEGGHGMRINLQVNEEMIVDTGGKNTSFSLSIIQKLVMAVCVCWGLIGTALFFRRRGKTGKKGG